MRRVSAKPQYQGAKMETDQIPGSESNDSEPPKASQISKVTVESEDPKSENFKSCLD